MARIRESVASAMADVSRAAVEGKNAAKWGGEICDKVWREGITITVMGVDVGVKLGAPDGERGPLLKKMIDIIASFDDGEPES